MHTYDVIGVFLILSMISAFLLFYLIEDNVTAFYQLSHTYSTFL